MKYHSAVILLHRCKCSKILNSFLFQFSKLIKCWLSGLEFTKCLSRQQIGKKQSIRVYAFALKYEKCLQKKKLCKRQYSDPDVHFRGGVIKVANEGKFTMQFSHF